MANDRDFPSVSEAAQAAADEFRYGRLGEVDLSAVLRAIAAAADAARAKVISTAASETALTAEELAPEFDRMVGTLRMFADLAQQGSWVRAAIDRKHAGSEPPVQAGGTAPRSLTTSLIGPNHDLRSMLLPLGPVAVFGASNFPLAYGVLGGDTASALAAGCPVIVKEHPAHPHTGRLLYSLARYAIDGTVRLPRRATDDASPRRAPLLNYVVDSGVDNTVGVELVRHRGVAAVGFTGSRGGGMALDRTARERADPIPVFAEMGSANRVIVTASALRKRAAAIAQELAASIIARHGQQCTKPGLIFLEPAYETHEAFIREFARCLDAAPARRMLSARVAEQYLARCRAIEATPGVQRVTSRSELSTDHGGEFKTFAALFTARPQGQPVGSLVPVLMDGPGHHAAVLRDETFGPAAIITTGAWDEFFYADPALVTTVYDDDGAFLSPSTGETIQHHALAAIRRMLATTGRLTFNSPTTGVRVATAMVHGGPFPATNAPHTTAVGPRAIERWARPVCFQNCPDALLPPELQNTNPRGILRTVNGVPTRDAIK